MKSARIVAEESRLKERIDKATIARSLLRDLVTSLVVSSLLFYSIYEWSADK